MIGAIYRICCTATFSAGASIVTGARRRTFGCVDRETMTVFVPNPLNALMASLVALWPILSNATTDAQPTEMPNNARIDLRPTSRRLAKDSSTVCQNEGPL